MLPPWGGKLKCPIRCVILSREEVRMDENELKERLLRESEDFKRIFEEHRQHEERLRLFQKKSSLTEQEKLEEVEL